ncbi:hypothetical protein BGZ83_003452 [Gryganskiella cystojenkinii]|nr:hypothetical protein BGZ83_003452 [Gryganskiella cystojenkinii]
MSSPLSALRRPRPLSLQGPRKPLSLNSGFLCSKNLAASNAPLDGTVNSTHGASHSVRWASLLPCTFEDTTPPPPPLTLEQAQAMQQLRRDQSHPQYQTQLEHAQRVRQQRELQSVLEKDRLCLEQQRSNSQYSITSSTSSSTLRRTRSIGTKDDRSISHYPGSDSVRRGGHRRLQSMFGIRGGGITGGTKEGGNGGGQQKMTLMTLATSELFHSPSSITKASQATLPDRLSQSILVTSKERSLWDYVHSTTTTASNFAAEEDRDRPSNPAPDYNDRDRSNS